MITFTVFLTIAVVTLLAGYWTWTSAGIDPSTVETFVIGQAP